MEDNGRVRSYNARRGRLSALTVERLETLGARHEIPDGPLDPREAFGRSAPVVLEIGCGHGAAALAYAVAHPGHDLLAVDVFTPALARMLAEADRLGVGNLWMHRGDAVLLLEDRIAPQSLAAVHLFFPDPWPKARHAKRRFLSAHTLDLVASRLEPGGHLLVATDHDAYAAHARTELAADGRFVVTEGERPDWRPTDGFEAKGLAAGRRVTELRAELR
ncbi:tRNA (guanosine(46)-N7)-methyltransferase TrmB [Nostocoides sp. HKS02]|uniref:tRNA (guanosine(46)-N7)-methyltransferase TrmB n=1 Tax=Nostocoides sp. HKS02 TaxID=1813880 RepID=UPI0012B44FDC|nr:tRNA (guanosine(46)-N7)-methyltransferase TrmB [Tetrasphaera sp. HKS02]QGN56887.1 tRNA (guanosine(46)-N7)-methyltransferase TrmB [Tetrasphaera sp. HKS02]